MFCLFVLAGDRIIHSCSFSSSGNVGAEHVAVAFEVAKVEVAVACEVNRLGIAFGSGLSPGGGGGGCNGGEGTIWIALDGTIFVLPEALDGAST